MSWNLPYTSSQLYGGLPPRVPIGSAALQAATASEQAAAAARTAAFQAAGARAAAEQAAAKEAASSGWWWLLGLLVLGLVVAGLVWLYFQLRGNAPGRGAPQPAVGSPCTKQADCAGLCKGARFPCVAGCQIRPGQTQGTCQTYAVSCIGPNKAWCPAAGECIDTTRQTCTATGAVPVVAAPVSPLSPATVAGGGLPGVPPTVAAQPGPGPLSDAVPATIAAAATAVPPPAPGTSVATAAEVDGLLRSHAPWVPGADADGERYSRANGRYLRVDSTGSLMSRDHQGNWWKKGTHDSWWLRGHDGGVLRKNDRQNLMWKRDPYGRNWVRSTASPNTAASSWQPASPYADMDMKRDVEQARQLVAGVVHSDGGASTGGLRLASGVPSTSVTPATLAAAGPYGAYMTDVCGVVHAAPYQ